MIIKTYFQNSTKLSKKNRYCVNQNGDKTTILGKSSIGQGIGSLCNENKHGVQKVMDSFLYSKYGLYPVTCFNKLIHIHCRCFNNTNKEIPVASFVGLSTGILGSQRED